MKLALKFSVVSAEFAYSDKQLKGICFFFFLYVVRGVVHTLTSPLVSSDSVYGLKVDHVRAPWLLRLMVLFLLHSRLSTP